MIKSGVVDTYKYIEEATRENGGEAVELIGPNGFRARLTREYWDESAKEFERSYRDFLEIKKRILSYFPGDRYKMPS